MYSPASLAFTFDISILAVAPSKCLFILADRSSGRPFLHIRCDESSPVSRIHHALKSPRYIPVPRRRHARRPSHTALQLQSPVYPAGGWQEAAVERRIGPRRGASGPDGPTCRFVSAFSRSINNQFIRQYRTESHATLSTHTQHPKPLIRIFSLLIYSPNFPERTLEKRANSPSESERPGAVSPRCSSSGISLEEIHGAR